MKISRVMAVLALVLAAPSAFAQNPNTYVGTTYGGRCSLVIIGRTFYVTNWNQDRRLWVNVEIRTKSYQPRTKISHF